MNNQVITIIPLYLIHVAYTLQHVQSFILGDQVEYFYTYSHDIIDAVNTANILAYATPMYQFGIFPHVQPFRFAVRGCHNVNVFLSGSAVLDSNYPFHNVVIGADFGAKIIIRHVSDGIVYQNRPDGLAVSDLLLCLYPKEFWVTWSNGSVRVGRGLIENQNELDSWSLIHPTQHINIKSLAVMTSYGTTGEWMVYRECKYNIIYRRGGHAIQIARI